MTGLFHSFDSLLITIIGIIIILCNIALALIIAKRISVLHFMKKFGSVFKYGYDELEKRSQKKTIDRLRLLEAENESYKVKFSMIERLDILYIERTNIKYYIPFLNIYVLLIIQCIIFLFSFYHVYTYFYSIISSILIGGMIGLLPLIILDFLGRLNSEKVSKMMPDFLTILRSYIEIKEDILYAMQKTTESNLPEPLTSYLRDTIVQIKSGIEIDVAFDLMGYKVNNPYFYSFILNIKQTLKSRGNLLVLLNKLENEAYLLDEERTRRNLSTFVNRLLIYIMIFISIFLFYYIIMMNKELTMLYTQTLNGRLLLNIMALLFFIGTILTLRLTKFNH